MRRAQPIVLILLDNSTLFIALDLAKIMTTFSVETFRVSSNSGTINSYKSLVIENVALYFYIAAGLIALLKKASNILVVYF